MEEVFFHEHGSYVTYIGPLGDPRGLHSYAIQVWTQNGEAVMSENINKATYVALVNTGLFKCHEENWLEEIE